jgi:hypothetical protein
VALWRSSSDEVNAVHAWTRSAAQRMDCVRVVERRRFVKTPPLATRSRIAASVHHIAAIEPHTLSRAPVGLFGGWRVGTAPFVAQEFS